MNSNHAPWTLNIVLVVGGLFILLIPFIKLTNKRNNRVVRRMIHLVNNISKTTIFISLIFSIVLFLLTLNLVANSIITNS